MLRTKFLDGQVASIKSIEMLLPLNCFGVVGGSCHGSLAGPEFVARGEVATSKNYPANQARAAQNRTGCGVRLHKSNGYQIESFRAIGVEQKTYAISRLADFLRFTRA